MALNLGELVAHLGLDTSDLKKGEREVESTGKRLGRTFRRVGATIAAAISVEAARRIILLADNMAVLERRLVRFTGTSERAARSLQELIKTANATGSQIQDTTSIFERFSLVRDDIGATNSEILQLTDTVSKLGALGGSSQAEISNSLRQMSQSFAGGVVRAEEFNSIIENTPEIIKAMAREMDMSMGEVRQRMLDGELTAEEVFQAMLRAGEQTNREFEAMPRSIEMATQALKNELTVAVAQLNEELGASDGVAGWVDVLTEVVNKLNEANRAQSRLNELTGKAGFGERFRNALGMGPGLPGMVAGFIAGPPEDDLTQEEQSAREMEELLEQRARLEKQLDGEVVSARDAALRDANQRELERTEARIAALREESEAAREVADIRSGNVPEGTLDEEGGGPATADGPRELSADENKRLEKLRQLNETEKEEIERLAAERREFVLSLDIRQADERAALMDEIEERRLTDLRDARFRELEIEKEVSDGKLQQADEYLQKLMDKKRRENDVLVDAVGMTSDAISNMLQATGDSAASRAASIISQVATLATTIATISAAQAKAQVAADPTAITLPQKIANIALITSQFVGIFSALQAAKGGGRQFGGVASPSLAHPINEGGTPEILEQAGRQYLLPNGKGGTISPMNGGATGGGVKVTLISNGTPQTVEGTRVTRDEVLVMINDATQRTEKRINSSLSTGRGDTARSLQGGFRVERNLR